MFCVFLFNIVFSFLFALVLCILFLFVSCFLLFKNDVLFDVFCCCVFFGVWV